MLADLFCRKSAASMKPGTVLQGKYRLISLLGEGSTAAVWSAEHQGLDAPVAIRLPRDGEASSASRALFEAEAKLAASLRSPHLARVFDFGLDEGAQTPFVVMELLEGESLRQRIAHLGSLPIAEVARIVTHVSRALSRAHAANVIHGELDPAKIFLVENGDEETAQVLGIARRRVHASARGPSATGTLPEKPHYMSPEQIRDSEALDPRTDLWSLGIIAFECLTGQLPFDADDLPNLALRICHGPLKLPSLVGPAPAGFDVWFQRATALRPAERFASAAEMAAELQALCAAPSAFVPRPVAELPMASSAELAGSSPFRATRAGRRWAIAVAGVLLCGAGAFALLAPPKADPAPEPIAAQPAAEDVQPTSVQSLRAATGIKVFGEGRGLTLLVDGKEIGQLPQELRDMEPGEHVIQVTGGSRYEVFQERIVVEPDRITPIGPIRLKVTQGLATIVGGEGAEEAEISLQVGDSRRVLPEPPLRLEVETDKPHVLIARRKGYAVFEQPITFEDGQAQKTIEITLSELAPEEPRRRRPPLSSKTSPGEASSSPAPSPERNEAPAKPETAAAEPARRTTLTLTSTPPSNVILDGKPLGPTPRKNITVEPGTHRVIFVHGASRKIETVEAAPGSNRTVSVNF